jgi:hypothetical protein
MQLRALRNPRPPAMAGLLSLLPVALMAGPNLTTESPLAWLTITSGPQVQRLAQSLSPALSALPDVEPYAVVVTNTGSIPIIALNLRWLTTHGGKPDNNAGGHFYLSDARRPILAPGQSQVFTPSTAANGVLRGAPLTGAGGGGAGVAANVNRSNSYGISIQMKNVLSADSVHLVLDLVVGPDGSTAGKDRGRESLK